jgi:hypothetical protein
MHRHCPQRLVTKLGGNRIASSIRNLQVGVNHPVGRSTPVGRDQTELNRASCLNVLEEVFAALLVLWPRQFIYPSP